MNTAIQVKKISCSYEDGPVLRDLSFTIANGEFFIIIGPNGSGKSTLMKVICGVVRANNGHVDVLGHPLPSYSRKALARKMAYVPQLFPTEFPFTVTDLVLMGRSPHLGMLGLAQKRDFEMAQQALAFTGTDHLSSRRLTQLSGGERQRVFIARAICQQPQVMLLDEPTASLDLAHQVRIMDLMAKLKSDRGTTIVMVSHDVNLAAIYGDRLLLLKEGQIISLGAPDQVLTSPNLEKAYGCPLLVDESPLGKFPRVTPVPQKRG